MSPVFVEGRGAEARPPRREDPVRALSELPPESERPSEPLRPETPIRPELGRQTQVRRVGRLESAAILGGDEATELLDALDVHSGYLTMLRESLSERPDDLELLTGAAETVDRIEEGLERFLACLSGGIPGRVATDLNELLPAMIPALAREVGEGGRLRIAPTSATLPVEANASVMERALVHLVRNAREASPPDQRIRLSWGPTFQSRPDGGTWEGARIRVEDHGEGIARQDLPWLFEPYFSAWPEKRPVSGLGLPVVQAVIEGHGGWVEIHSRRGEGTDVDLYLPLVSAPKIALALDGARTDRQPEGGRIQVLVLEDEPLLAQLVTRILLRRGCRVHRCATPVEAERYLRDSGGGIGLAVVGRVLAGGRPGVELASVWQARRPDLGVILLDRRPRGTSETSGREEGVESEVAEFPVIRPPFTPAVVSQVLTRAMGPAKASPPDAGVGIAH